MGRLLQLAVGSPSWKVGRSLGQRPPSRIGRAGALCKQRSKQLTVPLRPRHPHVRELCARLDHSHGLLKGALSSFSLKELGSHCLVALVYGGD